MSIIFNCLFIHITFSFREGEREIGQRWETTVGLTRIRIHFGFEDIPPCFSTVLYCPYLFIYGCSVARSNAMVEVHRISSLKKAVVALNQAGFKKISALFEPFLHVYILASRN